MLSQLGRRQSKRPMELYKSVVPLCTALVCQCIVEVGHVQFWIVLSKNHVGIAHVMEFVQALTIKEFPLSRQFLRSKTHPDWLEIQLFLHVLSVEYFVDSPHRWPVLQSSGSKSHNVDLSYDNLVTYTRNSPIFFLQRVIFEAVACSKMRNVFRFRTGMP